MTNEQRIAAAHKAIAEAGYDCVYGATVRPDWRVEGYNGATNLIVEYVWGRDGAVSISAYTVGPVRPDSPNFPAWLKEQA